MQNYFKKILEEDIRATGQRGVSPGDPLDETVWARLRQDRGQSAGSDRQEMPRTVNWITGPSRTADIEQTLLLGAHGPRKLIILLIDAETA